MEKTTIKTIIKNLFNYPLLWGSVVPIQLFGIFSIYNIFTGNAPSWWWFSTIIGYIAIMMFGIAICYHRLLSHKGFETNPVIKKIILWFAVISGQGGPIFWVTVHRGYHHRYTDKDNDPHSPVHGFWHSYFLWQFKIADKNLNPKYVIDLMRDPDCVFLHKHYQWVFWLSHAIVALISVDLWLYTMLLPAFITFHSYSIQTSFNHIPYLGYKNFETDDRSTNSIWLFPLILGEAWHNNHHKNARAANYGIKWWEIDPSYWLIKLIKKPNEGK
jgi:stearoyl-CoA desaturase (delta-9 desaturase)